MSINGKCPICRKPAVQEFRPFCSRGCRDRDLIGWVEGRYRVPVASDENEPPEPDES